jgi:hypothetical protein
LHTNRSLVHNCKHAVIDTSTQRPSVEGLKASISPDLESRRMRRRAAARFVGQLYVTSTLRKAVVHSYLEQLLTNAKLISEPKLEYLCTLLSVTGPILDTGHTSSKASRALVDRCISCIKDTIEVPYLSPRILDMLQVSELHLLRFQKLTQLRTCHLLQATVKLREASWTIIPTSFYPLYDLDCNVI